MQTLLDILTGLALILLCFIALVVFIYAFLWVLVLGTTAMSWIFHFLPDPVVILHAVK